MAEITSHLRQVHVLFSSAADAAQAATRDLPDGFFKYYEINTVTSGGSQVPKILIWDTDTFQANIGNPDYNPPTLWQNGQPALGPPVDFSAGPHSANQG